jgi:hypothetical protein
MYKGVVCQSQRLNWLNFDWPSTSQKNTHTMNPPKIEDDLALKNSSGEKLKLQMIAD